MHVFTNPVTYRSCTLLGLMGSWYFLNYEMCLNGWFSKIQSHIKNCSVGAMNADPKVDNSEGKMTRSAD